MCTYNQKRYLFSLPMLESYSSHINCVGLPSFNDFFIILSILPVKKNEINAPPGYFSPDSASSLLLLLCWIIEEMMSLSAKLWLGCDAAEPSALFRGCLHFLLISDRGTAQSD